MKNGESEKRLIKAYRNIGKEEIKPVEEWEVTSRELNDNI